MQTTFPFCEKYLHRYFGFYRQGNPGTLLGKPDVAGLGQKYYINSAYLGQIFRKKYGQSFKNYLCSYRINEACRQLLYTNKQIGRIAEDVGYKDVDYFLCKFIELKGCTPSHFRKSKTEKPHSEFAGK